MCRSRPTTVPPHRGWRTRDTPANAGGGEVIVTGDYLTGVLTGPVGSPVGVDAFEQGVVGKPGGTHMTEQDAFLIWSDIEGITVGSRHRARARSGQGVIVV